METVAIVSLLARSALGVFLLTRKSSWAKGFGIISLGSVAVSSVALFALKSSGAVAVKERKLGDSLLPPTGKVPKQVPSGDGLMTPAFADLDLGGLGVLLQGYSGR